MGDPLAAFLAAEGELRRVFLRDMAVRVRMGIHAFEQAGPQRVLVSVELFLAANHAHAGDDIALTVDYDFVRAEIAGLAAARHYNLQETFVHALAERCLARPGIRAVRVSSRKPDVYPDCDSVGYELTRIAADPPA